MSYWSRLARPTSGLCLQTFHGHRTFGTLLRRCYWPLPKRRYKKQKPSAAIIEDGHERNDITNHIADFKHYLKTTEIPLKLRMGLLKSKLSTLINDVDDYSPYPEMISTINAAIMHLYRTNGGKTDEYISEEDLAKLFSKTAHSLALSGSSELPEFMIRISQHFLESKNAVPDEILTQIISLGSSLRFGDFSSVLAFIVKRRGDYLLQTFSKSVIVYLTDRQELELESFAAFLSVAASQGRRDLIDNNLCISFIEYCEALFEERNPRVHEYQDLNKNIYRIQAVAYELLEQAFDSLDTETQLKLFKLKTDLNSVVSTERDILQVQKLLTKLNSSGKHSGFQEITAALFKQDLQDESLADSFLMEVSKQRDLFSTMRLSICKFLVSDDVKFSSSLRLRAELIQTVESLKDETEESLFPIIQATYAPYVESSEDVSESFSDIVQVLMLTGVVAPNGAFMDLLNKHFQAQYSLDPSIHTFKYRIDRSIELEDHTGAFQIFQESAKSASVHWDQASDPRIAYLLNRLIILLCEKEDSIADIFPKFRKIRQHMFTQVNAEAINALAKKMLAEECVGDTIELLKRELPTIDKEALAKLQVSPLWAYAYRELFQTLHEFVISYTNEDTHETNWILYGELHKYFHVPYATYLPTLEFFCKVDRLNAALVIFRQIKRLNELHGDLNHNLPPLKEMYMFLLKTFGDRLYEEGVVEIHEYLNMDVHMSNQDIDLQNCILNAYSNLQNVGKARDLFLSISSNAKENGGINEETVQIMIKTYTYSDMMYVKKFWNNLSQFGILPDYNIYKQYLIAHVYHGLIDDAFALVDEIDDYNVELSSDLLLAMHNYCLDLKKQKLIANWAQTNHKKEWEDVLQSGLLTTSNDYMPETNLLVEGKLA